MAQLRSSRAAQALALLVATVGSCNAGGNQPDVTVNGGCVGCIVNINPAGPTAKPAGDPDYLFMIVPGSATMPVTYVWHNRHYQGADAFLQVAQAEVAAWVERVKPSDAPAYGTLRVAFPIVSPPVLDKQQNTAGAAEAEKTWTQFWQVINEGRLKALEKSKLFSSISSETANISILDRGEADYALWFDGGHWHLRYHKGNPLNVSNAINPAGWVGSVNLIAKTAKSNETAIYSWHWSPQIQRIVFTVLGKDYFEVEPIIPVMKEEFARQGRAAPPIADRMGGKIKVVLATLSQGASSPFTVKIGGDPKSTELVRRADQEFALAAARGKIEALHSSKLFDSVTVETADVSDTSLDSYDVVLWQPATNPWTWRFRIAGKRDAFSLVLPPKSGVTDFAEIVHDNLRKVKPAS
jgi:hypothetical protein